MLKPRSTTGLPSLFLYLHIRAAGIDYLKPFSVHLFIGIFKSESYKCERNVIFPQPTSASVAVKGLMNIDHYVHHKEHLCESQQGGQEIKSGCDFWEGINQIRFEWIHR